jgi:poly(beta-D-mannuronate) lyase
MISMVTEIGSLTEDLPQFGRLRERGPFSEIQQFFTAVRNAQPGDLITLANGEYNVRDVPGFRERIGTVENPIIVRAQEPGKVILKGSSGYKFEGCTYFTWYGFHHAHKSAEGESSNILFKDGNNNRFARCEVNLEDNDNNKKHWLRISNSKAIRVDHCHFHHKKSEGQFCNIFLPEDSEPGKGPIFEYNYFEHQDFGEHLPPSKSYGDAGGEAIQMGHSDHARRLYRAIVRYNYFEECNGDGEIVSNKSCGNLYYNNTFTDCNGSLTLRHGHPTAVLANYFKNCGLRVLGAGNLIANNHFSENSREDNRRPLIIHNGKEDGGYERVVNNHIILNTFANGSGRADKIVVWGSGNGSKEPRNSEFRGNIITGEHGLLFELNNNHSSNTIKDNIAWATGDATYDDNFSTQMATRVDPVLTRDGDDGIFRLQDSSPARKKLSGTPFSSLTTVDIFDVTRSGNTDGGCCQFSTESTTRPKKRITADDVGVGAPTPWVDSPKWEPQDSENEEEEE